jgi:predicted small lipoprotein YifL
MSTLRSFLVIALLTVPLTGCGKGSGSSEIPTAGAKAGDLQGMSGFDVKLPKKSGK